MSSFQLPDFSSGPLLQRRPRLHRINDQLTLVYRSDLTLHQPLTLIRKRLVRHVAVATADLYTRHFLDFEEFLIRAEVTWDAAPGTIRQVATRYIQAQGGHVTRRQDHLLASSPISPSAVSTQTLRLRFEALRSVYAEALRSGLYPHNHNPFERILEMEGHRGLPAAPPSWSGLSQPRNTRSTPQQYFIFRDGAWTPTHLLDPVTLYERVLAAFTSSGSSLRDQCIVHLLFQGGARVSEICTLSFQGWRYALNGQEAFGHSFKLRNKGSGHLAIKPVHVDASTGEMLRQYFLTERRMVDPLIPEFTAWCQAQGILEGLPAHYHAFLLDTGRSPAEAQLFLNVRGEAYTANAFRKGAWRPFLHAAGLEARPHQARHAFVTQHLRGIDELYLHDPEEHRQARQALAAYMFWRNPVRTFRSYDHSQTEERTLAQLTLVRHRIQQSQGERRSKVGSVNRSETPSDLAQRFSRVTGVDHV